MSTRHYPDRHAASLDVLCEPLTIAEAAARTCRSTRTIRWWIKTGKLTAYEGEHRREVVLNYRDVVETEKEMRAAAAASRAAIAARARAQRHSDAPPGPVT